MAALRNLYVAGSAHPSSYKDMTYRDVVQLAAVLSRVPSSQIPLTSAQYRSYRSITQDEISNLPPRLLSQSTKGKAYNTSPRSQKQMSELCSLHRPLNEALIASLFRSIKRQLEEKIPAAMNSIQSKHEALQEDIFTVTRLAPLNDVPRLWIEPQVFTDRYGGGPPGKIFTYQADRCSACILARLGSDPDVLVALLAAMKMHMAEDRISVTGISVRISWVQQWMRQFPRKECEKMLSVSNQIGDQLKLLYRQARSEARKRERLGGGAEATKSGDPSSSLRKSESSRVRDRNISYVQNWLDDLVIRQEDSYELATTSSVYPEDAANATELSVIDQYTR